MPYKLNMAGKAHLNSKLLMDAGVRDYDCKINEERIKYGARVVAMHVLLMRVRCTMDAKTTKHGTNVVPITGCSGEPVSRY